MLELSFVLLGLVVGFVGGIIFMIAKSPDECGNLIIRSDEDGEYMFLESSKQIPELKKLTRVIFRIVK